MNKGSDIFYPLSAVCAFVRHLVNSNSSIPPSSQREGPNAECIEAIREGNEFLSSGMQGRFTDGKSLIEAAME